MVVVTPTSTSGRRRSFFRETADLPRYEQHGFISRHVSEKALEAAWRSRVRWHDMRGRPRHSRRVLEWNGLFVLYDLHLPPAAPLPELLSVGGDDEDTSTGSGTRNVSRAMSSSAVESGGSTADRLVETTSACGRGATFRSNGALVSSNGRYTFVQHNDNELVIYDAEGGIIWAPGPAPDTLNKEENKVFTVFQRDGNLVRYAEGERFQGRVVLWQAGVAGAGGDRLVMRDDGNLVIYNTNPSAGGRGSGGGKRGWGGNKGERRPSAVVVWESGTSEHGGVNRLTR